MSSLVFLITGATGATGGKTIDLLRERGHRVRAFVHHRDEQSAQLEREGVEIAVGDLLDFTTIRPALDGVSGAYFVYPIALGLIEATAYFAQAAKEAEVPAVVNMSEICAQPFLRNGFSILRKVSRTVACACHLVTKGSMPPSLQRIRPASSRVS